MSKSKPRCLPPEIQKSFDDFAARNTFKNVVLFDSEYQKLTEEQEKAAKDFILIDMNDLADDYERQQERWKGGEPVHGRGKDVRWYIKRSIRRAKLRNPLLWPSLLAELIGLR